MSTSILGVGNLKNLGEFDDGDLDNKLNSSFYGIALGGVTHRPTVNRCCIVQLGDRLQFAFDYYDLSSKALYMRIKSSANVWNDWVRFSYTQ